MSEFLDSEDDSIESGFLEDGQNEVGGVVGDQYQLGISVSNSTPSLKAKLMRLHM